MRTTDSDHDSPIFPFVAREFEVHGPDQLWVACNDFATAADHDLIDIAPDPDVAVAVNDRHRVIVGLVAHQGLRTDAAGALIAGVERRGRLVGHRGQIPHEALANGLGLAPQDIRLAHEALLLQVIVERSQVANRGIGTMKLRRE